MVSQLTSQPPRRGDALAGVRTATALLLAATACPAAAGCGQEPAVVEPLPCGALPSSGKSIDESIGNTVFSLACEVGEIRVERILTAADGTGTLAAHAYFFNDQDPPARGFGVPIGDTSCVDYRDRQQFSGGFSLEAQAIADSRTYLDAGGAVTLTGDGGDTIELARTTDAPDRSSVLTHDILYQSADDLALFRSNTRWTFTIPGSEALPDLELRFPESAVSFDALSVPQVITPSAWTPGFVTEAEYFAGLTIPADQPFEVSWIVEEPLVNEDVAVIQFVDLGGDPGVDFRCFDFSQGEQPRVSVPPEILAELPDTGTLVVGTLTHIAAESQALSRGRFDMLGVDARLTTFTISREQTSR